MRTCSLLVNTLPIYKKILNPPESSRIYSSIFPQGIGLKHAMLDNTETGETSAWCVSDNNVKNNYVEIDAGKPMHVLGVVVQGRNTGQYVTRFRIEYGSKVELIYHYQMPMKECL